MRIALVSEHASPLATLGGVDAGGQNVHVAALATELGRFGHEVLVHTRRDDPNLPARVTLAPGVVVDHVDAGPPRPVPKDQMLPFMDDFARRLRETWSQWRPDLAHAHFWMSGVATVAAASALAVPVVQTFHALGSVKRRHQGDGDTSPPERATLEPGLLEEVDLVIATSYEEVVELDRLGADLARVEVVPCGVDLGLFQPDGDVEATTPGRARIVTLGRLVERKGMGDAVAAMAQLPDAELVIAGGPAAHELADDPEAARLLRLARRHGVEDRVVLRGQVERAAVPRLLRSADAVACVPWYEPFGLVPLEAMACGVPVVGSAVGGIRDTVVDHVTGLLVPPRSPDAVAAALAELLRRPHWRRAMGVAGARRAWARYAWPRIARSTLEAYTSLTARAMARERETVR